MVIPENPHLKQLVKASLMKEDLVRKIMVRISLFQLPVIMCAVFAVYFVTTNVKQFKQEYDLNLSKYLLLRGRENFQWNNSSEAIYGANSHWQ